MSQFSRWLGHLAWLIILWPSYLFAQSEGVATVMYKRIGPTKFEICADLYPDRDAVYDVVPGFSLDGGRTYIESSRLEDIHTGRNRCFTWDLGERISTQIALDVTGRAFQLRVIEVGGGIAIRGVWLRDGEQVRPHLDAPVVWSIFSRRGQLLGRIVSDDGSGGRIAPLPIGQVRIVKGLTPGWRSAADEFFTVPKSADQQVEWVSRKSTKSGLTPLKIAAAVGAGIFLGAVIANVSN